MEQCLLARIYYCLNFRERWCAAGIAAGGVRYVVEDHLFYDQGSKLLRRDHVASGLKAILRSETAPKQQESVSRYKVGKRMSDLALSCADSIHSGRRWSSSRLRYSSAPISPMSRVPALI